jgi:hypothetical protein
MPSLVGTWYRNGTPGHMYVGACLGLGKISVLSSFSGGRGVGGVWKDDLCRKQRGIVRDFPKT